MANHSQPKQDNMMQNGCKKKNARRGCRTAVIKRTKSRLMPTQLYGSATTQFETDFQYIICDVLRAKAILVPPRLPVNGKRSRGWTMAAMAVDAPPPLRCDGQVSSTTHGCALNGKTQLGNILTPEPSHARPTCPPHVPRVRSAFLMTLARAIRTVV